jgi:hypothetical protein
MGFVLDVFGLQLAQNRFVDFSVLHKDRFVQFEGREVREQFEDFL